MENQKGFVTEQKFGLVFTMNLHLPADGQQKEMSIKIMIYINKDFWILRSRVAHEPTK